MIPVPSPQQNPAIEETAGPMRLDHRKRAGQIGPARMLWQTRFPVAVD